MPRADLNRYKGNQDALDAKLLKQPAAAALAACIDEKVQAQGAIPTADLAALLGVKPDSLRQLYRDVLPATLPNGFDAATAQQALAGRLPQILGWRSLVAVAKELGWHRNQVESFLKKNGHFRDLQLAADMRLYVAPKAEEFIKKHYQHETMLHQRERLGDFAQRLRIKPNQVTAFFAARKLKLVCDHHGHVRLSTEQKEQFIAWREELLARRQRPDIVVAGVKYSPIIRIAETKAALFGPPESAVYQKALNRETGNLFYFAKQGKIGYETKDGIYIPSDLADRYLQLSSPTRAARLLRLSVATIKTWLSKHPQTLAEPFPGKLTRSVALDPLIQLAQQEYEREPKLKQRESRPIFLAAWPLLQLSAKIGSDYSQTIELLPLPTNLRQALYRREGTLDRSHYQRLIKVLQQIEPHLLASDAKLLNQIVQRAGEIGVNWRDLVDVLPLVPKSQKALKSLQGVADISDHRELDELLALPALELLKCCNLDVALFSGTALQRRIAAVAEKRQRTLEQVYTALKLFFAADAVWPSTYQELEKPNDLGADQPQFPAIVAVFLDLIGNPQQRLHALGEIKTLPQVNDLLVHPTMKDFGLIARILNGEGGLRAQVAMVRKRELMTIALPAGLLQSV